MAAAFVATPWQAWNISTCFGRVWTKNLVGGWTNPSQKYARQIGSLPQVGVKIQNIWNHHLEMFASLMGNMKFFFWEGAVRCDACDMYLGGDWYHKSEKTWKPPSPFVS